MNDTTTITTCRCPACHGLGLIAASPAWDAESIDCPTCGGLGELCAYHDTGECVLDAGLFERGGRRLCLHHAHLCDHCGRHTDGHLVLIAIGEQACQECAAASRKRGAA